MIPLFSSRGSISSLLLSPQTFHTHSSTILISPEFQFHMDYSLLHPQSLGQCLEFGDIQKNKLSEWTKQVSLGLNAITFPQPNLQILPHLHPFLFSVVALVLLPYKETLPLGFWAPASFLASQGINPSLAILLLLSVSPNLKKNPLITTYHSTPSTPYFLRPLYS